MSRKPMLAVLFDRQGALAPASLTAAIAGRHPSLADARCEGTPDVPGAGWSGLWRLGPHAVAAMYFDEPLPADAVETCVAPAHYEAEVKAAARAHRSHLILSMTGDGDPVEQSVVLAAIAGGLVPHGAIVAANGVGNTSFPARGLVGAGDVLAFLRKMPLLMLYAGFVKYNLPNSKRVWMRTFGNDVLGLPDLARFTDGHHQGEETFHLFLNVLYYLLDTGARFEAGHTMSYGDDQLLLRAARPEEPFLASEGPLFVLETIAARA